MCSGNGSNVVAAASFGPICTLHLPIPPAPPVLLPRLSVVRSGANVRLSWLVPSTSFVLQHNSDLTTTNWTDLPMVPTLNFTNLQYEVTVSPSFARRFYRLEQH
jgi:hypothetical protein